MSGTSLFGYCTQRTNVTHYMSCLAHHYLATAHIGPMLHTTCHVWHIIIWLLHTKDQWYTLHVTSLFGYCTQRTNVTHYMSCLAHHYLATAHKGPMVHTTCHVWHIIIWLLHTKDQCYTLHVMSGTSLFGYCTQNASVLPGLKLKNY